MTDETRAVEEFDAVRAGAAFEVTLVRADQPEVVLTVNQGILDQVRTDVRGGTLTIEVEGSVSNATLRAEVRHTGELTEIRASGAAKVEGDETLAPEKLELDASGAAGIEVPVEVAELDVEADGASEITLEGTASELEVEATGASQVDAADVDADRVEASASGGSTVEVSATETLEMEASGGSTIRYRGGAEVTKSEASGGSTIEAG